MEHLNRDTELPLSRRLSVADAPPEGLDRIVTANPAERQALAEANGLAGVDFLEAVLHIARAGAEGLEVSGELRATVRQICVVTLEEFSEAIVAPISVRFAPLQEMKEPTRKGRDAAAEPADHHIHDLDVDDPPDPIIGGEIDLGALASEFLTLALDPYPRKPGVTFSEPNSTETEAGASPFARLKDIGSQKQP